MYSPLATYPDGTVPHPLLMPLVAAVDECYKQAGIYAKAKAKKSPNCKHLACPGPKGIRCMGKGGKCKGEATAATVAGVEKIKKAAGESSSEAATPKTDVEKQIAAAEKDLAKAEKKYNSVKSKNEIEIAKSNAALDDLRKQREPAVKAFRSATDERDELIKERTLARKDPATKKAYKDKAKIKEIDAEFAPKIAAAEKKVTEVGAILDEENKKLYPLQTKVRELEDEITQAKSARDYAETNLKHASTPPGDLRGGEPNYELKDTDIDEIDSKFGGNKGKDRIQNSTETDVLDAVTGQPVRIDYSATYIENISDYLPNEINKGALTGLKKSTGDAYEVVWWPSGKGTTDKDNLKVALKARKGWAEMSKNFKEGDIVYNSPVGGANGARARAYERMGFSKVHEDGGQWGRIGKDGKIEPIQLGKLKQVKQDGEDDSRNN